MDDNSGECFTKQIKIEDAKRVVGLKHSAYKDYIAARILFLNEQPHQAAIFANTCIEKEIKACLSRFDFPVSNNHNTFKLLNLLVQHDPNTAAKLNAEFIKTLSKIYESRYHENLSPGYNFVITNRKFLAELDYTYSILEPKVRFLREMHKGQVPLSLYEIDVKNKLPSSVLHNYLYNDITKHGFLMNPDVVFEFRIAINHEVVETYYEISTNVDFEKFAYIGLHTDDECRTFKISHHIQGKPLTTGRPTMVRNGVLQRTNVTKPKV